MAAECLAQKDANAKDAQAIGPDTDLIGFMLQSRGLTRETARLDAQILDTLASQQRMVQPHFMRYWKNPYEFPKFAAGLLKDQENHANDKEKGLFELFALSQARTGHRAAVRFDFVPVREPAKEKPIQAALEELARECGAKITAKEMDKAHSVAKSAPVEVQRQIAKFLLAACEAKHLRDRALRNYPKEKLRHAFDYAVLNFTLEDDKAAEEFSDGSVVNWDLGQALDFDDLYAGAGIGLRAVVDLEKFLTAPQTDDKKPLDLSAVKFEFDTPLGKVVFNGKHENNLYQGEDYLLIVDLAGNDFYKGATAAAHRLDHPISVVIDRAGDDIYMADKKTPCAQGAGILGYGFLIDNEGDDMFTAVNNAQGMCYFGVGILWARGGNDTFKAHTAAQGSAAFGVANLVKIGGNDSYDAYFCSQGFGFVRGYGCLIDTDGNDRYVAEPYDLVHPAKLGHDNLRNYSFCQGAGWGQRGDMFGGHAMGGGTGILQDLGGNDWYESGVFAQATGYWYGTGILHDKAGDDHYEGSFFVQSGTAHMGLTLLLDEAGNDSYHVWHAISQAGAHDGSVSFFIDKGGDDAFSAWEWKDKEGEQTLADTGVKGAGGGVLLGSAINNSIAVFIKTGGKARYEYYTKDSFGYSHQNGGAGTWRYEVLNAGLFIAVGCDSDYEKATLKDLPSDWGNPQSNASWSRQNLQTGNKDKVFGMGLDAGQGKIPEATP
jgi:hypothetical protein